MSKTKKAPSTTIITYSTDEDANGTIDWASTHEKTTDKKGNLVLDKWSDDWNLDGSPDNGSKVEQTFNKAGLLTSRTAIEWDGNETTYYEHSETEYKKGVIWKGFTEYDWDKDGLINRVSSVENTINKKGLITDSMFYQDDDANGTVDYQVHVKFEYNKKGLLTKESSDFYNDGTFEHITTYDTKTSKGNTTIVKTDYSDSDNDGVMNRIVKYTKVTDKNGNILYNETDHDDNGDGVSDGLGAITSTFNKANQPIHIVDTIFRADGSIYYSRDYKFDYENGKIASILHTNSGDGIDTTQSLTTFTTTYDPTGLIEETIVSDDLNMDGVPEHEQRTIRGHNDAGQEIYLAWDYANDGTLDIIYHTDYMIS